MTILLTIIITYFIGSLFGYVVHYALHQKWSGKLNKSHMAHHIELYPAEDFFSDTYREAGSSSTARLFLIASLPLALIPITLYLFKIISLSVGITALVVAAIMGALHDYIHDSFHITNHWLNNLPIFRKWLELHKVHHSFMQRNFGIFSFGWDIVFRSYKAVK
jgi:sterol desaturase/sphingolipid hydroxylase (fatty acid hydroxylase superfamily)